MPKILLVVGHKNRRTAFSSLFKSLGCQVLTTVTAHTALAALDGFQPNVLLTDMELEDMEFNNFLREVKKNPISSNIEIVTYTKFLDYKLTNPACLENVEAKSDSHALEILKNNISIVPGEIVLWVYEALTKQKAAIPAPLKYSAEILANIPKT